MAPLRLTPQLQSLPPILHRSIQESMSSYSKGARGLSVQLRETGIFTGTTNSLSLSLRQRPTRYAIHAGRNLPDKGFRYLRTVHYVTHSNSVVKMLLKLHSFTLHIAMQIGLYHPNVQLR